MKVLIADDHFAVREGLKVILKSLANPRIEWVGEASSLEDTRGFLGRGHVELVLLDINFADGNGLDLVSEWAGRPGAPRFLILSMYQEGPFVLKALQAGARGFVGKDSAGDTLETALDVVGRGGPTSTSPASTPWLAGCGPSLWKPPRPTIAWGC